MTTNRHICVLGCTEDGAQALAQALCRQGASAFFSYTLPETPSAFYVAFVSGGALEMHSFRAALNALIAARAPLFCMIHPSAGYTPALEYHLARLHAVAYDDVQSAARLILADGRARACIAPYVLVHIRTNERIAITHDGFKVGRSAEKCDFVLPGDAVSRLHAIFTLSDGQISITDSMSMNGVLVNGVRLEPGEPCELEPEDELEIGTEKYLLLAGDDRGDGE